MNITSVRITPVSQNKNLKAFVSIVIDSCFAVHGLKIIQKEDNKIFVAMPNKLSKEQKFFRDICHPLTVQARQKMEKVIFSAYYKMTNISDHQNHQTMPFKKAQ